MSARIEDVFAAAAEVLRAEHYDRLANDAERDLLGATDERDLEARGITATAARMVVPNVRAARNKFAEALVGYIDGGSGPREGQ